MSKKIKVADIGWSHCTQVDPNNKKKVKCNYCNKVIHGVNRVKLHLGHIIGDVIPCPQVPTEIRKEMKALYDSRIQQKSEARIARENLGEEVSNMPTFIQQNISDDVDDDETTSDREMRRAMRESKAEFELQQNQRQNMRLGAGSSSGAGAGSGSGATPIQRSRSLHQPFVGNLAKQSSKQPKIKTALKNLKDARKKVGKAISQFFLFSHIPFNAANPDNPYYRNMVNTVAECGPGILPPTPYEISNTYLTEEFEDHQKFLDSFSAVWDEYGVTLMCDGWTTQNRRSIINFLVYSPAGTVFLNSVDASDHVKNSLYIMRLMKDAITKIGEKRVVQVVTDNGANYKAAGQALMLEIPHIFWTPCAAHCIDLMLEDIASDEHIKSCISTSQKITNFIYNHGWALSIMRRETTNGELVRPAITRFATHFLAIDSILKHKIDLKRMIHSQDWHDCTSRLHGKDKKLADDLYLLITGEQYWTNIAFITGIFRPLVKVLRMVDSDDKAEMGHLYEAMDRAKEELRKNVGRGYKKWWTIIDKRWERQLHQDLHAAGYFLNPNYQYSDRRINDAEVVSGFRKVIDKMEPDPVIQILIKKEAEAWRLKTGVFGYEKSKMAIKHITPAQWWAVIAREETPNLAKLAARILSQTVSSSNCERNWSTFSLIHTRPRNRLSMDNLQKLVFVHYNMRLRLRNTQRKNVQKDIDLDSIFHDEDPLVEWVREQEDCVLDDRENQWLEDALSNEPQQNNEDEYEEEDDNDDDDDDDSGGGVGHSEGGGSGSSGGGNMGHYQLQRSYTTRADSGSRGKSGGTGVLRIGRRDGPSGRQLMRETNLMDHTLYESSSDYQPSGSISSYGEPSNSSYPYHNPYQENHSAYDNMMTSFFGGTGIDHLYPQQGVQYEYANNTQQHCSPYERYQYQRHDDYDDDSHQEAPRRSFWV